MRLRDPLHSRPVLLALALGLLALLGFAWHVQDERLHQDAVRDLLLARDCAEGHCPTIGAPTSFGGFHAGGTWIALLGGLHFPFGSAVEAGRVLVLVADAVAVFLLAVFVARRRGALAAVAAAVVAAVAVHRWALEATVWTPALLPLWSVAVLARCAAPPHGLADAALWGGLLAVGMDLHPMAAGLLPGSVWLVARASPQPILALATLFGVAGAGCLVLSPDAVWANAQAIAYLGELHGPTGLVAPGLATAAVVVGARVRPPAAGPWSSSTAASALVVGHAGLLAATIRGGDGAMNGRYLLPILAPAAWWLVSRAPRQASPGAAMAASAAAGRPRYARTWPAGIVLAVAAAALVVPGGRSGPRLSLARQAVHDLDRVGVPLAARPARLQVAGCDLVASAMALYEPARAGTGAVAAGSGIPDARAWRPDAGVVDTALRPERGRFCLRTHAGSERCELARPVESLVTTAPDARARRAYPRWTTLAGQAQDAQARFFLPVELTTSARVVEILDARPAACAWRIVGAVGLTVASKLPARRVVVRAAGHPVTAAPLPETPPTGLLLAAPLGPECGSDHGFSGFLPCVADGPVGEAAR